MTGLRALVGVGSLVKASGGGGAAVSGGTAATDLYGPMVGAETAVGNISVNGAVASASITAIANSGGNFFTSLSQLEQLAASQGATTLVIYANAVYNPQIVNILLNRYGGVITSEWTAGGTTFYNITVVLPLK
jgi:hypothetical protein